MKNIIKYNKIIEEIVFNFTKRFYKEVYNEEAEKSDFYIMNYVGINQGQININDMYLSIDDILIAELYQIPSNIYAEWYEKQIETEGKLGINLYNYFRKHKKANN